VILSKNKILGWILISLFTVSLSKPNNHRVSQKVPGEVKSSVRKTFVKPFGASSETSWPLANSANTPRR
jgi:hypothetical protein